MMTRNCRNCGTPFRGKKYRKATAHFCSKTCAYTHPDRARAMSERIKANPIPRSEATRFTAGHRQSAATRLKMRVAKRGKAPANKKPDVFIRCACCGVRKQIVPAHIGRAKYCSRQCHDRHKDHGKTAMQKRLRTSPAYAAWRTAVFTRDDYTCQGCGQRGGRLHADHLQRFADFPSLRFNLANGQTLCVPCHRQTATYGNRKAVA